MSINEPTEFETTLTVYPAVDEKPKLAKAPNPLRSPWTGQIKRVCLDDYDGNYDGSDT